MHATALKRKLRNTQSQWGKNAFGISYGEMVCSSPRAIIMSHTYLTLVPMYVAFTELHKHFLIKFYTIGRN